MEGSQVATTDLITCYMRCKGVEQEEEIDRETEGSLQACWMQRVCLPWGGIQPFLAPKSA